MIIKTIFIAQNKTLLKVCIMCSTYENVEVRFYKNFKSIDEFYKICSIFS